MSLAPGTKLGRYEIRAKIGEGGMGEVYRASDTKLNRGVAIKILPEAFAHDSDRLARFRREAQVLASLNHPNIAAIYELEEFNGVRCLVMELVPGQTLAERLKASPLRIEEALGISVQITDPGTVMGTVGYMSPEQVRGHEADHRSDIFSFGSILYEMLSALPR